MKKIALLAILALSLSGDEIFNLSIEEAFKNPLVKKYILPDVEVEFADTYTGDRVVIAATASRKTRGDISRKKQKCEEAFLDAVNAFQRRVKKEKGQKAVNIVSFLYGNVFSSKTEFQCLYTNKFTVRLRGDIAK